MPTAFSVLERPLSSSAQTQERAREKEQVKEKRVDKRSIAMMPSRNQLWTLGGDVE